MKHLHFKHILIWSGIGSLQWLFFVTLDKLLRIKLYSYYGTINNESSGRVVAEVHIMSLLDMRVIYLLLLFLFIFISIIVCAIIKNKSSVLFRWEVVGLLPIILWTVLEHIVGIFGGYSLTYLLPGLLSAVTYVVSIQIIGLAINFNSKRGARLESVF